MKILIVQLISFAFFFFTDVKTSVELTNIKCAALNKEYADFEYCFIKAVNRSYKYISLKAKLFKLPVNNATIQVGFLRKANGYKPFMFNVTFDACEFMRNRKNGAASFFYQFYKDYSNLNHTCPYNEDVMVEKLPISHIQHMISNVVVIPAGDYGLSSVWSLLGTPVASIKVYATLK